MFFLSFLPFLICAAGSFLLYKLKFFFIVHPLKTSRLFAASLRSKKRFRALSLALAGTLGVGNIVGVAVGLSVGGAGSLFWMLVSAVFASVIKYAESALSADSGRFGGGGIMLLIRRSFGKPASVMYAVLMLVLSVTLGTALQAQSAASAQGSGGAAPSLVFSTLFALLLIPVLIFGRERLDSLTAMVIPAASAVYIALTLSVIIGNISRTPEVIGSILSGAFAPSAASGGVIGFLLSDSLRIGFARGLLSNEAGAGSSSVAQSSADGTPSEVGLSGMAEVFFDTVLLCTLTGLAVLYITPEPLGISGDKLLLSAFSSVMGKLASPMLTALLFVFAYSTSVCWFFYGSSALKFVLGDARGSALNRIYIPIFIISLFLSALMPPYVLLGISDTVLFLMTLPTLAALIKNSERLKHLSEHELF